MDRKNAMNEEQKNQPHPPPSESKGRQDKTRPMQPYEAPESGGPMDDIDEGPAAGPVDDIQGALADAARQGEPVELDFDELPEPVPELDEGPPPGPVDDIQGALFEASLHGEPTDVDFEALPEPGEKIQRKVVHFTPKPPAAPMPVAAVPATTPLPPVEPVPLPEAEALPEPPPPPPPPAPPFADFWPMLIVFAVFRLLTLFLLKPGGFIRDWSDFDTYLGIAGLSDYALYPFLDFWLEWPPLIPWLMVGAYKLSLLLPPWPGDPRLWFVLILGSGLVLFEVGNFVLIYRLARRFIQTPVILTRVMWLYAGLFPPVYAMLGFFDGVALFFILLTLELLLADRRLLSAGSIGVGFMVKILPVLMLPVALRRLWFQYRHNRRDMDIEVGLYAVVGGLTIFLLLLPFVVMPVLNGGEQWWITSFRSILGRSAWETVWAVADGYYGFGSVGGDRLNQEETNFAVNTTPQITGWVWSIITLAFAALYAFIFTRPADYNRPRTVLAFGGLTVALFMLWSKGYSPQFLVYLLPFIILLFPNGRGLTYALILTALNVLEQPIYFVLLPQATWLLTFVVFTRFLIICMVAVDFAVEIWSGTLAMAALTPWRRYVPLTVGSMFGVALLIITPLMLKAYSNNQLANSPSGTFVGFMQAQAQNTNAANCPTGPESLRLFVADQPAYRQLYPYLRQDFEMQVTTGAPAGSDFPAVANLLPNSGLAWILPSGPQAAGLANGAARQGRSVGTFNFANFGTASLYNFSETNISCNPKARFTGGIDLLTQRLETNSGSIRVTIFWQTRSPQSQNLTVFTHLLDANGQWVTGHDSVPQNGTAPVMDWPVDTVQADSHHLNLPANLPPGEYTIVTGIYNDTKVRLSAFGINGVAFTDRAVPLTTIQRP
jgi:hypothetical protein